MTSSSKPRIAFLGTDLNPISIRCLEALVQENRFDVLLGIDSGSPGGAMGVLRRSWKRHGPAGTVRRVLRKGFAAVHFALRRCRLATGSPRSLKELAWSSGLECLHCRNVNGSDADVIRAFAPELIVVANFSRIIRRHVLAIPPRGVINFHPSLLPRYRGPMPCCWIVKNREVKSGVTIHFIDEGIDTGDIILQAVHDVLPDDDEATLRARSIAIGAPLLADAVRQVLAGTAARIPQTEDASHYGLAPRGASSL